MNANTQHSVNELARVVEPHAVESWPARETLTLQGWLLRFSDGSSSRSNSVSTLAFEGHLDGAIDAVEDAYRRRGLPPLFQVSPASKPDGLEQALIARGYKHKPSTMIMVGETAAVAAPVDDIRVGERADSDFVRLTLEGSHSPDDGRERLATLARLTSPKVYVVALDGGEAVSCGASAVTGDWASVYVMRTQLSRRRRGFGRRVLKGIAVWARSQGAKGLYLQVDESNAAGRALYARAGFRDGYRCLHYFAPESQT